MLIDPSGTVVDTHGDPVSGAATTLLRQGGGGAFAPVPALGGEIEPAVNPETTGSSGEFHWDAVAGTYEVQAQATGCHDPGSASQPAATTAPFLLPPPAVGLLVTLDCTSTTAPVPSVTGLSPATGPTDGGTLVQITGTNLGGATAVYFGSVQATSLTVLSPYAVAAVAPPGSATVDVTVRAPGGTSAVSSADRFTYANPTVLASAPTIQSVSPASGPVSGGTKVTLTGTNLGGVVGAQIGTTAAVALTVVSPTEITLTAPPGLVAGPADITLSSTAGPSAISSADVFVYDEPAGALPPPTTVAVSSRTNPAPRGNQVVFVASVGPSDGGGTVTFFANGSTTPITGCLAVPLVLTGATFESACSTSTLPGGSDVIVASYSGDHGSSPATGSFTETVQPSSTLTKLTLSTRSAVYGDEQLEKLSVTVVPAVAGVPSGKVDVKSGTLVVCVVTLTNGTGSCRPGPVALPGGAHLITANYLGDGNDAASKSAAATLTVGKAPTSSTLGMSATRVTYGAEQVAHLSVLVKGKFSGTPLGTVTFSAGKTVLCRVNLVGGKGTCSPAAKALAVGSHAVTAAYGGNVDFLGSVSATKVLTVVA